MYIDCETVVRSVAVTVREIAVYKAWNKWMNMKVTQGHRKCGYDNLSVVNINRVSIMRRFRHYHFLEFISAYGLEKTLVGPRTSYDLRLSICM